VSQGRRLCGPADEVGQAPLRVEVADLRNGEPQRGLLARSTARQRHRNGGQFRAEVDLAGRGCGESLVREEPEVVAQRDGEPAFESAIMRE
jgi:hypothetical protein